MHLCKYGEYQDTLSIKGVVISIFQLVTCHKIPQRRNKYYKSGNNGESLNPSIRNSNKGIPESTRAYMQGLLQFTQSCLTIILYPLISATY